MEEWDHFLKPDLQDVHVMVITMRGYKIGGKKSHTCTQAYRLLMSLFQMTESVAEYFTLTVTQGQCARDLRLPSRPSSTPVVPMHFPSCRG